MKAARAGWYPDPGACFDRRWWDGKTWSRWVAPLGDEMREEGAQSDWDPPPGTAPVLGCALGGGLTFLAWTVVFVAAMGNANGDFSTPSWVFWAAFGVAIVADVIGLATLISRSAAETRAFAQVSTTGLVLSWAAWLTVNGAYFWMFATATSARGVQ